MEKTQQGGRGLKERELNEIIQSGADVVTMGNHVYYRKEAKALYKHVPNLLIPANITNLDGKGIQIFEKNGKKIAVLNLIGKVHMGEINNEYITCPFKEARNQLDKIKSLGVDYVFVDFHAEATAEKRAMAYYLVDDATCVYGTHTHIQTSDEQIISGKLAYITDVGMTGPRDSVLGLKTEIAVARFITGEKIKYECSENEGFLNSVIVETDDATLRPINIKRLNIN